MTVQTTSSKAGPFFGNGATLVWNSGFRIDQPADLWIVYTDPTGVETQLDATLYTATGFGDPDGVSVTYPISGMPISAAESIALLRVVNYDQQTSITNQGGFYPQVIERALDRIVYQTQQLAERLGRAITLSASSALSGLLVPDPEAGKFLRGRLDGAGYENAEITGSGTIGLPLPVSQGGTQADNPGDARANLGLGSVSTYDIADVPGNGMKNRIINGGMDISQRGTSFSGLTTGVKYTTDRWAYSCSSGAVSTVTRQADAPSTNGFQNSTRITVTTADAALAATDQAHIRQIIEGYNVRDLIGRDIALSFWVRSAKTGVHCVSFRNTVDRSYIVEYTINAANTWEQKTITLSGGLITDGTWNFANGAGLVVGFTLAAGANFVTTSNNWQVGLLTATVNQVNCLDTVGNIFAITGVQLEAASLSTSFEYRQFSEELSLCQRYYEKTYNQAIFPGAAATVEGIVAFTGPPSPSSVGTCVRWVATKRAIPTVTIYSSNTGAINSVYDFTASTNAAAVISGQGETGASVGISTIVAGHIYQAHLVADSEL